MTFELMLLAQRRQHGHSDQAACFQIKAGPLPHITSGVFCNVVLHGQGESGGVAKGVGDKLFTHYLLAGERPASKS